MTAAQRPSIGEIYRMDLDRHLFAPAPRRSRTPVSGSAALPGWVRDLWELGRARRKWFAWARAAGGRTILPAPPFGGV